MAKPEVYSWRVSRETKAALEEAARRMQCSMADLLETIASEWLRQQRLPDDGEQARLHAAAERAIGTLSGGGGRRSERARELVRKRLARRRAG